MEEGPTRETKLIYLALPLLVLLGLIGYGLVVRPYVLGQSGMPLEIIFIIASCFAAAHLFLMGHSWATVFGHAMRKLSIGMPTIMILFGIGIVIGSWMVSGVIPMFVYYGIKLVNPDYIYVLAFIVPIFFSLLTGTSWGSVGTIGVVIFGVATVINADLAIVAGAVIGGAYFGDKLSPLSDTTNIAALAADVELYDHINSMLYTTLPSALIAAVVYTVLGFVYPPEPTSAGFASLDTTLAGIEELFHFNVLLLAPVVIVLAGSWRRLPTIPVLLTSSLTACLLGGFIQDYSFGDIIQSIYKGFHTDMAVWATDVPANISELFNRGGLYALNDAIIVALFVFVFIGMLDTVNAIPVIMGKVFAFAKSRVTVILSSLLAAGFTNAMTGNQYATSFIVGEAFKSKYDKLHIQRKVLSRSLEDYGTMIESLIPWHPTALFMVSVMGVVVGDYWHWQLLTLINLVVAPLLAITGIGCFYGKPTD